VFVFVCVFVCVSVCLSVSVCASIRVSEKRHQCLCVTVVLCLLFLFFSLCIHACCCLQKRKTALMKASQKGHSEIVGMLIKKGAKVDLQDKVIKIDVASACV